MIKLYNKSHVLGVALDIALDVERCLLIRGLLDIRFFTFEAKSVPVDDFCKSG